jgi:hypothetical protein
METPSSPFIRTTDIRLPPGGLWTIRDEVPLPIVAKKGSSNNEEGTPPQDADGKEKPKSEPRSYRCVACSTVIAQPKHLCHINSKSSLQAFMNPQGVIHELRTFSEAIHYKLAGEPTPGDTWFPGYWWLFLVCETCHSHLGWGYFTPTSSHIDFFGIRTNSVQLC